jgi:hypothetical protein
MESEGTDTVRRFGVDYDDEDHLLVHRSTYEKTLINILVVDRTAGKKASYIPGVSFIPAQAVEFANYILELVKEGSNDLTT